MSGPAAGLRLATAGAWPTAACPRLRASRSFLFQAGGDLRGRSNPDSVSRMLASAVRKKRFNGCSHAGAPIGGTWIASEWRQATGYQSAVNERAVTIDRDGCAAAPSEPSVIGRYSERGTNSGAPIRHRHRRDEHACKSTQP
jgi:hypothetical protein